MSHQVRKLIWQPMYPPPFPKYSVLQWLEFIMTSIWSPQCHLMSKVIHILNPELYMHMVHLTLKMPGHFGSFWCTSFKTQKRFIIERNKQNCGGGGSGWYMTKAHAHIHMHLTLKMPRSIWGHSLNFSQNWAVTRKRLKPMILVWHHMYGGGSL